MAILVAIGVAALAPTTSRAQDGAATPLAPGDLGVRLSKAVGDGVHYAQGSGVYLGDGLVLTAAHVVNWDPDHDAVRILLDGIGSDGVLVFDSLLKDTDLAIVKMRPEALTAARRRQAPVSVCPGNTPPDHPVTVAALGKVSGATTIPAAVSSMGAQGDWTNILSRDYQPGNSGGGVFDPDKRCLWGIILAERSGKLPSGLEVHWTAYAPASLVGPFVESFIARTPPTTAKTP